MKSPMRIVTVVCFLAPAAALLLSLGILVPHVSAQERPPISVAQAGDGALYVITPLGRYALVPDVISDEDLATLGQLVMALPPRTP